MNPIKSLYLFKYPVGIANAILQNKYFEYPLLDSFAIFRIHPQELENRCCTNRLCMLKTFWTNHLLCFSCQTIKRPKVLRVLKHTSVSICHFVDQ